LLSIVFELSFILNAYRSANAILAILQKTLRITENTLMNKYFKLTYLLLLLTLSISCVDKKTSETETNKSPSLNLSNSDTLKFTSGIRSILHDSKGKYWLGSHQEGVCLFDGKSFVYYTTNDGLPDNQIRSIQEDKHGHIWFGTANGVCRYDGKIFTNYNAKMSNSNFELGNTDDYLWFGAGTKSGINQFDGKDLSYLPFPITENENFKSSYGVTAISKGIDGKIWIATYAALFYFDGKEIRIYDSNKLPLKRDENLHIRSVFVDSKGRIWIGNNGIGVILLQGDSAINFSDKNGLIHLNSSKDGNHHSSNGTLEHVFAIAEDANGNIWFGDRDTGPWKYDGKTITNYTIYNKLSTQMIWCIYNDNSNNLLFGIEGSEVYKFNGSSFTKIF
jgi:ligand-binding sensor domain-containing protein